MGEVHTPDRIWATGNGKTGSWNATEGRMKIHLPDGWQFEYLRATPAREAAEDLVEALWRLLIEYDEVDLVKAEPAALTDAINAARAVLARAKGGAA